MWHLTRRASIALVVLIGSAACSSDNIVNVNDSLFDGLDRQLITKGGVSVVHLEGTFRIVPDAPSSELPCYATGSAVPTAYLPIDRFSTTGVASHLGKTSVVVMANECEPWLVGILQARGDISLVGANGDGVYADRYGRFAPDGSFALWFDIAGGTGRFEGAFGMVSGLGTTSDPPSLNISGGITTPGSLK